MILKPVGLLSTPPGSLVPAYDPLWDDVEVLLPFCESSGATPVDYASEYEVSLTGAAAISSNQSKFYSGALATGLAGVAENDYAGVQLVQRLMTASVPFTVEWWARPNGVYDEQGMFYQGDIASNNYRLQVGRNTNPQFYWQRTTAAGDITLSSDVETNVWAHWAIERCGNRIEVYKNGVSVGSLDFRYIDELDTSDALRWLYVGVLRAGSAIWSFNGYFNDFRLTLASRYDGMPFDPPAALMTASYVAAPFAGTITDYAEGETNYREIDFTRSGTLTLATTTEVEYLLIGGGGGGGGYYSGGGGGAGGVLSGTTELAAGTYPVVIGARGRNGWSVDEADNPGSNGGNSTALGLTAIGGGYGGGNASKPGNTGGSGGGGGTRASSAGGAGTSGQGYAGGMTTTSTTSGRGAGGGGGGASEVGADAPATCTGGDGGDGIEWPTGSGRYWAGGGGGGAATGVAGAAGAGGLGGGGAGGRGSGNAGQDATVSTGSGGGGGGNTSGGGSVGGYGASGRFIIRYVLS